MNKNNDYLRECYLDNAATTCMSTLVLSAMEPYFLQQYGNPSSKTTLGLIAKEAIENAREIIADAINCEPEEIYFTSGGSESDNWAIKGLKNKYNYNPMHMISTSFEHHAILETLKARREHNGDILYTLVNPDPSGIVSPEKIEGALKWTTELCSVMMVNNELGTIQPIKKIGEICEENSVIFHTDAVQAFGHIPINVKKSHIKLLSASAHKLHGPKGVGFLYISNEVKQRYVPLISGGQQERGMRASTENVPGIVGFGKATEIALASMKENEKHECQIRNMILVQINQLDGVHLNGKIEYMDPRHLNLRVDGCRGEELQALFNEQGIYLSTGSACNSESGQPSHVLKAIGLSNDQANSSIRISIGEDTTEEDVQYFVNCLKDNINLLRR